MRISPMIKETFTKKDSPIEVDLTPLGSPHRVIAVWKWSEQIGDWEYLGKRTEPFEKVDMQPAPKETP